MTGKDSKKRILLVDDDPSFLSIIETSLRNQGYEVLTAGDGRKAAHAFAAETFDLVISDIQMPDVTGIHLMHFMKKARRTPLILMTGNPDRVDGMGAAGFLKKPFTIDVLLDVLRKALAASPSSSEGAAEDYCKIKFDDFVAGKEIRFDVYHRMGDNNYERVWRQGQSLTADRVKILKAKNIRFLYMAKEDFRRYIGFNPQVGKGAAEVDYAKRSEFLKYTSELIDTHLRLEGLDAGAVESAKTVLESTVSVLVDRPEYFDLLSALRQHSEELYVHSLGVALMSTLLARNLKWTSPITLFKIAAGGLFHDIGKKDFDPELLGKTRSALSEIEVMKLEGYPAVGASLIQPLTALPSDVIQIVSQHHDRLKKNRTHPLARVVKVADDFCDLAVHGFAGPRLKPVEAVRQLGVAGRDTYEPSALAALSLIFGLEPQDDGSLQRRKAKMAVTTAA